MADFSEPVVPRGALEDAFEDRSERMRRETSERSFAGDSYEHHRYEPSDPLIARYRGLSYEDFAEVRSAGPKQHAVLTDWDRMYRAPFVGVTSDGDATPQLYPLTPVEAEDRAPAAAMLEAAKAVFASLDGPQAQRLRYDLDAREWRAWSNPEFLVHAVGLRLELLSESAVDAILGLIRASLSPVGYDRVTSAMRINGFLGGLLDLPMILNERSYQLSIFGEPSLTGPWGWQLFGHHVAVNVLVVEGHEVIAPVFLGAEPNELPGIGGVAFQERQRMALELVRALDPDQRTEAVIFDSVRDPAMPDGRIHPFDERHLAGAFQDNRVIPYEGLPASEMDGAQRELLLELVADHLALLPDGPRRVKLREVRDHLDDTRFCFIGRADGVTPFYFRVQSPVVLAEFDHHAGVWLRNPFPALFHAHTTLRYPNGNDYGKAYIAAWKARARSSAGPAVR